MGEPSRRQFLGAAAALAALPSAVDVGGATSDGDERPPLSETQWGPMNRIRTLGNIHFYEKLSHQGSVVVSSHPELVSLKIRTDDGEASVCLLPEAVDALRADLAEAKSRLDPEQVGHAREWIEGDLANHD